MGDIQQQPAAASSDDLGDDGGLDDFRQRVVFPAERVAQVLDDDILRAETLAEGRQAEQGALDDRFRRDDRFWREVGFLEGEVRVDDQGLAAVQPAPQLREVAIVQRATARD